MLKPLCVNAQSAEFTESGHVIGVFLAEFSEISVSKPDFVELANAFKAAPAMFEALEELTPPEDATGWWCPTCRLVVPGQEVTYSEHHTECGTYLGAVNNAEWVNKAKEALRLAREGR